MSDRSKLVTTDFGEKLTPEQVLIKAMGEAQDMKGLVLIALMDNNELMALTSSCSALQRLGMLEWGKRGLLDSMSQDDDR